VKTTKYASVVTLSLIALLVPRSVRADTQYTYTGSPYTSCSGVQACVPGTPIMLSVTFDTATPLAANLPLSGIMPSVTNFTISGGLRPSFDIGDVTYLMVSTDAGGDISTWQIDAYGLVNSLDEEYASLSTTSSAGFSQDCSQIYYSGSLEEAAYAVLPGTWTVTQTGESVVTPEPGSLMLLGAGFLGLAALVGLRR
jgi:hypothetical protein